MGRRLHQGDVTDLRALRRQLPGPVSVVLAAANDRGASTPAAVTPREREVLVLLAKGLAYEEIGRLLGLRLGTVQCHIKRLYGKLEINTKAEAALVAAHLGLV